jgi:integrase
MKGDRWQVRWRDENDKQCSANRPKLGGTKGEGNPDVYARALDNKIQAELDAGTYVDPAAGKVTLQAFARQWRDGLTGDPASLIAVDNCLAHIIDVPAGPRSQRRAGISPISGRPMAQLARKPSLIKQWIKHLTGKGLSDGYVHQICGVLSSVFIAAMDDGIVHRNPLRAQSVTIPPTPRKKVVPWTYSQVRAAGTKLGGALEAMVDAGAGAGLRQGEIFGLAVDDIEFLGGRVIHVRRQVRKIGRALVFSPPKRGKTRDVPLSDSLSLRLAAHIEAHPPVEVTLPWRIPDGPPATARLVFVRADGRPHNRQTFSYHWGRARAAAGAPATRENGMHVLRHTFASACLAEGVDIRTLAEWLGHSDPGFTLRTYAHLMPSADDKGRRAMDAFYVANGVANDGESARNVPSGRKG